MNILSLDAIKNRIDIPSITTQQIQGFIHYSNRKVIMPPPGYFAHNAPHGSYHIKYGHLENDPFWVVKIAGGPHHLPIQGMMLAIDIQTGKPLHLLQDNGYFAAHSDCRKHCRAMPGTKERIGDRRARHRHASTYASA